MFRAILVSQQMTESSWCPISRSEYQLQTVWESVEVCRNITILIKIHNYRDTTIAINLSAIDRDSDSTTIAQP